MTSPASSTKSKWRKLQDPADFSSLMASCPVCFLSTVETNHINNNNVMVISWLTAGNNKGRLVMSLNRKRYTASVLTVGSDFCLSIPVAGMEELICHVGSIPGKFVQSKFPGDLEKGKVEDGTFQLMSKRAKKKHMLELGVPGLCRVALGQNNQGSPMNTPSSLFAIDGTVAHIQCRLLKKEEMIIDNDHFFLLVDIQQAFVREDYWNPETQVLAPREGGPCTLSFFGSQSFGCVRSGTRSFGKKSQSTTSNSWICLDDGQQFSRLLYTNPLCLMSIGNRVDGLKNSPEMLEVSRITATNNVGSFMFCLRSFLAHEKLLDNPGTNFHLFVPIQGMEDLVEGNREKDRLNMKERREISSVGREIKKAKLTGDDNAFGNEISWEVIPLASDNAPQELKCIAGCVAALHCQVTKTTDLDEGHLVVFAQALHASVNPSYWDAEKNWFAPTIGCPPYLKRLGKESIAHLVK